MKKVINSALSRRHFLRLTSMAAVSALAPTILCAEQQEAGESAASQAVSARIATFEEIWRTVQNRFYDPHLHGLDWPAVRERYMPDATRVSSEEALASVINSMLSELHASHTRYYTPYEQEYYQLSGIFAGALRRRGLERAFPGGRISYPGIGVFSRADMQGRSMITGVIEGTPAKQAGLLAGDEIVFADGAPFQPVQSFRGKVDKEVVLGLRRVGAFMQISVTPVDIEPDKMFLDGLKASARIIRANGRSIGYVHVWCYAGSVYQRTLEHLLSQSPLNDADALIWDLRDGWGGAIPEYLDLFNTRAPTMQVTDRSGASPSPCSSTVAPAAARRSSPTASRNIGLARSSVARRRELSSLRRHFSLAEACCYSRSRTCGSTASGWKALASHQRLGSKLTRPPWV
jgi:carboxyl-terminal processing protease